MRLRNIPTARDELAASSYVIKENEAASNRGKWTGAFSTLRAALLPHGEEAASAADAPASVRRPICAEIGMGKGRFLLEMARLHPDTDFIGIEQYSSVLVHAVRSLEQMKRDGNPFTNVLLLRMNAEYLTDYFSEGEIDRIYLNFSDPWPKERHAKRRLPGRIFLARYEKVLSPCGTVEFKTDNRTLFDFALAEAEESGWILDAVTYDLHHDAEMMKGNVMTEYEEKFSSKGNPIFKLIMHPSVRSRGPHNSPGSGSCFIQS